MRGGRETETRGLRGLLCMYGRQPLLTSDPTPWKPHLDEGNGRSFPSPPDPTISRIAEKLDSCFQILLFKGIVASDAHDALPTRAGHHGCLGGEAQRGEVCTQAPPPKDMVVEAGVRFSSTPYSPPTPPNSIARWTLSRVCGTPSIENVRAYAVALETVPRRSSRTASSSQHLLCQCLGIAASYHSCHLSVESTRRRVSYETHCPVRAASECTCSPARSCSDGDPSLPLFEAGPLAHQTKPTRPPPTQVSGLVALSSEIMPTYGF